MAGEVLTMIEGDLATTVESDFASAVTLKGPDGTTYATSAHGGPLYGRVTRDYETVDAEGNRVIVQSPCVIMRMSSLARIPKQSENWGIAFAFPGLPVQQYVLDATRAPERADSIGFIRLFPIKAQQS